MNRLGIDNLMADLTADMALQLTSDYIIYRDEKDIHGIWVYEPTDRDRIGEKLLECCKRATDDSHTSVKPASSTSSGLSDDNQLHQPQQQQQQQLSHSQNSSSHSPESGATDPLSQMLNAAMSRARVSETSGVPTSSQSSHADFQTTSSNASTPVRPALRTLHEIEQELAAGSSASSSSRPVSGSMPVNVNSASVVTSPAVSDSATKEASSKNEIPSFLMAIISKDKDQSSSSQSGSPGLSSRPAPATFKDTEIAAAQSAALLHSLSGNSRSTNGGPTMAHGPPLSAELLPPSVMPSGLYGSMPPRSSGAQASDGRTRTASSSTSGPAGVHMGRSNGMPPQQSPHQAPAFAYSPGMMHSPLAMSTEARTGGGPGMNGVMMHGPPLNLNGSHPMPPPPPPMPFQHHPGMTSGHHPHPHPHHHHPMGGMPMMPPHPPPMPGGPNFPAESMHAAMGAVGFMQQRQQAFHGAGGAGGAGAKVLDKEDFSRQFKELLQNDPEFMDV
ncbi:hypothetical protein BG004_002930, partial [Podila humilis]